MAKTVPFSEARARLSEVLDEVQRLQEHVVVTRNGRPAAVILSADEYESLQETLEILSDPETMDALREAEEDVAAGRVHLWEDARRDLGLA